jgi:hypothetical protein
MLRDKAYSVRRNPFSLATGPATVDEIHDITCRLWAGYNVNSLLTLLSGARALGEFVELADERTNRTRQDSGV